MNILKKLRKTVPGKIMNVVAETGKICEDNGRRAYLVGGIVRDILLGRTSRDIDITIETFSDRNSLVKRITDKIAKKQGISHVSFYEDFGTASLFLAKDIRIDIAAARSEVYKKPGALPEVGYGNISADLFRRDFTINSMAVPLTDEGAGVLFDPYGGLKDLKKKEIRVLHEKSFIDDPTRILRALRFAARLNFKPEKNTKKLLISALKRGCLGSVSKERIRNEFLLALKEKDTGECLDLFCRFGVNLICSNNFRVLNNKFLQRYPVETKLAVLLYGQKLEKAKTWLKEMKISRSVTNEILDVFRFVYWGSGQKLPVWAGDFLKVIGFKPKKISITGEDLIKFGLKPGPLFGRILKDVNCNPDLKSFSRIRKYIIKKYK